MKRISYAIAVMLAVMTFSVPAQADLASATGKVTFLRVNEVGRKFGPIGDQITAEVVVQLDSQPGKGFGFRLLNDDDRPVRQGMLDLLRDAFNNNWTVKIDYQIDPGKNNGIIVVVRLIKP